MKAPEVTKSKITQDEAEALAEAVADAASFALGGLEMLCAFDATEGVFSLWVAPDDSRVLH